MRHLVRRNHVLGTQQLVKLLLREHVLLEYKVIDAAVLLERTLGNLRTVLVAKHRVKCRDNTNAAKQRENIAKRKTLKEELLLLLSQNNTQEKMSLSLITKALNGDTKAFEIIRDTIGEKPVDKVQANVFNYEDSLKAVDGDEY